MFPELSYGPDIISLGLTNAREKADALNSFFVTCFNHPSPQLSSHNIPEVTTRDCPIELLCKVEDVFEMSKASGPDGISGRMLKYTACSIAPALTKIFNLSISTGIVPDEWKLSHVVPIPKSNKYDDVSGYRPISLLSICSKMLEKHVSHLLMEHFSQAWLA